MMRMAQFARIFQKFNAEAKIMSWASGLQDALESSENKNFPSPLLFKLSCTTLWSRFLPAEMIVIDRISTDCVKNPCQIAQHVRLRRIVPMIRHIFK